MRYPMRYPIGYPFGYPIGYPIGYPHGYAQEQPCKKVRTLVEYQGVAKM
jgi:hypothetical protein